MTICLFSRGIPKERQMIAMVKTSELVEVVNQKPLHEYQAAFAFQFFLSVDCGWMFGRMISDLLLKMPDVASRVCRAWQSVVLE